MALFGTSSKKKEEKKGASAARVRRAQAKKLAPGLAHDIIRAPWFSEKAILSTERGVYAFAVPKTATKADIAGAIKELYKVTPKKIRIVNLPGKVVMLRTRRGEGQRAARRKAYVYLAKGDTIAFA